MKHVTICRYWKESNVREKIERLLEHCSVCGVYYEPVTGVCQCPDEPKVSEWNGIGWRPDVELSDADQG